MKKQDFTMTVNGQDTNVSLSLISRYGQPAVRFTLNSNGCANEMLVGSKDDLLRIAEFLKQRCEAEESTSSNPSYESTGLGLCVMEYSGKILDTYYGNSNRGIEDDVTEWNYESLHQRFPYQGAIYVLFELYDRAIARQHILKVIQSCVAMQARFVATGIPMHCNKLLQQDVADKVGCDITIVSRSTQNARIFTPHKTFTLDNNATSLDKPSLFDTGCIQHGIPVSRLEVVELIKKLIDNENPAKPLGDQAITDELQSSGYQIERRTVVKYRDMLGIPNSNRRRVALKN